MRECWRMHLTVPGVTWTYYRPAMTLDEMEQAILERLEALPQPLVPSCCTSLASPTSSG